MSEDDLSEGDTELSDDIPKFQEAKSERGKARNNWGTMVLILFTVSTIGTIALLVFAFCTDRAIAFHPEVLHNQDQRLITVEVVLKLIDATIFQVGAATAVIIGWAFFGSKASGLLSKLFSKDN